MAENSVPTNPPDDFDVSRRRASYTYRTPGQYRVKIPSGTEFRAILQGGQGGGGGAGYATGGFPDGGGGGTIVPGEHGQRGEIKETPWARGPDELTIITGKGGDGGQGIYGLHGGRGADGWIRVEIRRWTWRSTLKASGKRLWRTLSTWGTWQKVALIVTILGGVAAVVTLAITLL